MTMAQSFAVLLKSIICRRSNNNWRTYSPCHMKKRLLHTIAILMLAMPSFAFDGRGNLPYQIVQTRICELWDKPVINSKRPIIAIIDTGVETDHPDLLGNIWYNSAEVNGTPGIDDDNNGYIDDYCGWNFSTNTNDVTDTNGHGTICSSIAAGSGKINPQALGANPNALIMPLKVNGGYKNFSNEDIIAAIKYAVNNGADIISMSFGAATHSEELRKACAEAAQQVILISSAGNESAEISLSFQLPAAYPEVIAVEASDKNHKLCGYSDYDDDGPYFSTQHIDGQYNYELRAPGDSIFSATCNSDYTISSGTSMAGALMAGAISLLITVKDYTTADGRIDAARIKSDLIMSRMENNDVVDLLAAYNRTQPATSIYTTLMPRNVEAQAGLSIHLTPLLKSIAPTATGVKLHFSCADDADAKYLSLPGDVSVGNIANDKTIYANPVNIGISPDCPNGKRLIIKITATSEQGDSSCDLAIIHSVNTVGISKLECVLPQNPYNIAGQRVTSYYKGIVIRNGKKFLR